jgi:hypothetical protein
VSSTSKRREASRGTVEFMVQSYGKGMGVIVVRSSRKGKRGVKRNAECGIRNAEGKTQERI